MGCISVLQSKVETLEPMDLGQEQLPFQRSKRSGSSAESRVRLDEQRRTPRPEEEQLDPKSGTGVHVYNGSPDVSAASAEGDVTPELADLACHADIEGFALKCVDSLLCVKEGITIQKQGKYVSQDFGWKYFSTTSFGQIIKHEERGEEAGVHLTG